jgi:hypothetical protein
LHQKPPALPRRRLLPFISNLLKNRMQLLSCLTQSEDFENHFQEGDSMNFSGCCQDIFQTMLIDVKDNWRN